MTTQEFNTALLMLTLISGLGAVTVLGTIFWIPIAKQQIRKMKRKF